jgi:hypothetical protein
LRTVLLADGPFSIRFDVNRVITLEDRYGSTQAIFDGAAHRPVQTVVALLWAARAGDTEDDVRPRIAGMAVETTLIDVLAAFHAFFDDSPPEDSSPVVGAKAFTGINLPPELGGSTK